MSRPIRRARWARCALALLALVAITQPAFAEPKKRGKKTKVKKTPVSLCASFDQVDKDDAGVDLVVGNQCDVGLTCAVSWTLTCTPRTGRATHNPARASFALDTGGSQSTLASTAQCGNDGWVIDDVSWSCQPQPPPKVSER